MRRPHTERLGLLALGLLVSTLSTSCAGVRRIPLVIGVEAVGDGDDLPALVVALAADERRPPRCARTDPERLRRRIVASFLESGSYRVLETVASDAGAPSDRAALSRARIAGAERVVLVRLDHLVVEANVHHVHRYYDASAAAHATLLDATTGRVLRSVDENAFVSTRVRYADRDHIHELVVSRLAEKISRRLLGRETGAFVDLADPRDGSARPGIELAKQGRWRDAIERWEEHLDREIAAPSMHHNLAVAFAVLGQEEVAREHASRAVAGDRGNEVFRRTLESLEDGALP